MNRGVVATGRAADVDRAGQAGSVGTRGWRDRTVAASRRARRRALDHRTVLRLIAVERGLHAVIFALVAVGLVLARHEQRWLIRWARELKDNTSRNPLFEDLTDRLADAIDLWGRPSTILVLTAALFALVEALEAYGLWRGRRWAPYLTVVVTAVFLPFAIGAVVDRATALRLVALAIDLGVLGYLLWFTRSRHAPAHREGGAPPASDRSPASTPEA